MVWTWNTKLAVDSCSIIPNEQSKWLQNTTVESYLRGMLFNWELKKLEEYDVITFDFDQLQFLRLEWSVAPWIINIIEPGFIWLVVFFGQNWSNTKYTGFIYMTVWHFPITGTYNVFLFFFKIPIEFKGACTSKIIMNNWNTIKQLIQKYNVIPIDEMTITILWFLYSL